MTSKSEPFERFSAWVNQRAAAVRIRPETMERANEIIGRHKRAKALYDEWLEDVIADPSEDDDYYSQAVRDPDGVFLAWLAERYRSPYHVSYRHIQTAARKHGDPGYVMTFLCQGWPRELAEAHRQRQSNDDDAAMLAHAFLDVAQRSPGRVFQDLIEINIDRLQEEPLAVQGVQLEPSGGGQAMSARIRPAYVIYMQTHFGQLFEQLSLAQVRSYAEQARAQAHALQEQEHWRTYVADMIRRPVSHYPMVVSYALQLGLTAHQLCEVERDYVTEILNATRRPSGEPAFRDFLGYLRERRVNLPEDPEEAEIQKRRAIIAQLDRAWTVNVPMDLFPHGDVAQKLDEWQTSAVRGDHTPARDPVIDFIVFLKRGGRIEAATNEDSYGDRYAPA